MFLSSHYAGQDLVPKFRAGEPWKKVFGPVFIYLNSASIGDDPFWLWEDAKIQVWLRKPASSSCGKLIVLLDRDLLVEKDWCKFIFRWQTKSKAGLIVFQLLRIFKRLINVVMLMVDYLSQIGRHARQLSLIIKLVIQVSHCTSAHYIYSIVFLLVDLLAFMYVTCLWFNFDIIICLLLGYL